MDKIKSARAVIGANYGDEGKGLMTDFFSNMSQNPLVVRFNGGAQAGHTVVSNGQRHVFSHIGSGTFTGCDTFLSRFFVVNPYLLYKEIRELQPKLEAAGLKMPKIYIDPNAPVSTLLDAEINRQLETKRGEGRHGSCGIGFSETLHRVANNNGWEASYFTASHLQRPLPLFGTLYQQTLDWYPGRFAELGLEFPSPDTVIRSIAMMQYYAGFISAFCTFSSAKALAKDYDQFVFEGAQGLRLDEDNLEEFPHLTRSKTGCHNVLLLAKEMGIEDLELTYVSRTYMTRHGRGKLANEYVEKPNWIKECPTNVTNQWQEHFRYAPLDQEDLTRVVRRDLQTSKRLDVSFLKSLRAGLAFTHTDELPVPGGAYEVPICYYSNGEGRKQVIALARGTEVSRLLEAAAKITPFCFRF